jgi:hypothetical protein
MNLNSIKSKKSLKIVTLLVSSLLIATASAQVYRYMYISGTINISNTGLTWVLGEEAPTGSSIDGSTVTLVLPVSNGTTASFTHVLYLENLDTSTDHDLTIEITDAADPALYVSFTMDISDNSTSTPVDSLNVLTTDSYSGTIGGDAVWQMAFNLETEVTASGSDSFSVKFTYQ